MAEKNAGKAGIVIGGAAAVMAAIALAKERVALAAPNGVITLDEVTMKLLIAMAETSADIEELVDLIASKLTGQDIDITVQGYPDNTESIIATRVQIAALATPYQLPVIVVPDGMALQIKGWPTNGGIIYVGSSRATCVSPNQAWPLLANEAVGYFVKNAEKLFISGTAIGDWAAITVEQRRRA